MDVVVYRIKNGTSLYTAALVDFETLKDEVEIDDESFYVTTNNEEDLIQTVLNYIKVELRHQLRQNIIKDG